MELFKLYGSIFIDNDEANKSMSKSEEKAEGLGTKLGGMAKKAGAMGAVVAGGAMVAGTALFGMAKKSAETTDRIDKMSQKIGLSREGFQEWEYVMSQNGMEIDVLKNGMKSFTTQVSGIDVEGGRAIETFKALGVETHTAGGELKGTEELMNESILALSQLENETERATIANQLFGRAGVEMAPLLNSGAESIEELKAQAHELGIVMGDDAVDAGVEFTDAMDNLERSFGTVITQVGTEVMPILLVFMDWIVANMPTIKMVVSAVFDAIGVAVRVATDVITNYVLPAFQALVGWVQKNWPAIRETISNVMNRVREVITNVLTVVKTFWDKWGSTIMNYVKFVFGLIRTYIDTAMNVIRGVIDIVMGIISGDWSKVWEGIKKVVSSIWNGIKKVTEDVIEKVREIIANIWGKVKDKTSEIWDGIKKSISDTWDNIKKSVTDKIEAVKKSISDIWDNVKDKTTEVWTNIKNAITEPINNAKEAVSDAIDRIKGFFDFEFKWPKLKMPKFSISGSMNPMKWIKEGVPKLSVNWNADGGIFKRPTIFDTSAGLQGVGEAGPEAIMPLSKLQDMLDWKDDRDILVKILKVMEAIEKKSSNIVLDGDKLVGGVYDRIDEMTGFKQREQEIAYGG